MLHNYTPCTSVNSRCACADGQLSNDGKHCRQSSAFVIFAIEKQIRFLYLDPRKSGVPYPPISNTMQQPAVALDFDYDEKLIFFTVLRKSIMSVYINGSGLKETSLSSKSMLLVDVSRNGPVTRCNFSCDLSRNDDLCGVAVARLRGVTLCNAFVHFFR